ncbi:MAG: hypothetical protein J3K34DRAFT_498625 [Monoraphidium minutum]|nr:MAG: hypothetical protein J3K34DRAFT_498625 [Monoraphidium minutum]
MQRQQGAARRPGQSEARPSLSCASMRAIAVAQRAPAAARRAGMPVAAAPRAHSPQRPGVGPTRRRKAAALLAEAPPQQLERAGAEPRFPWPEDGPRDEVPRLVTPPAAGAASPAEAAAPAAPAAPAAAPAAEPQPGAGRADGWRRRNKRRRRRRGQQGAAAAGQPQPTGEQQQQQQEGAPRQPPAAAAAAAPVAEAGGGAVAAKRRKSPRVQEPITPKDQDLRRWYADAVRAAEAEHARAAGGADGAPPPAPLGRALSEAAQAHLDARLSDAGFEARAFPPLAPLAPPAGAPAGAPDAVGGAPGAGAGAGSWRTLAYEERVAPRGGWGEEGGYYDGYDYHPGAPAAAGAMAGAEAGAAGGLGAEGEAEAAGEGAPRGGGGSTSHAFVEWALEEQRLPLLASQWDHGAHSWFPRSPGAWLQSGHAAHEWAGAAEDHARCMIELYESFVRDALALPVVAGRRSPPGTLAGAAASYTLQALLPGGRALQVASSHFLADNFSRARGAALVAWDGTRDYINEVACGLSPAALRALALAHGDGAGLVLPPALAPVQVVIAPVLRGGARCDRGALAAEAERLRAALDAAGVRAAVDGRSCVPGVKFGSSERRGVPLRIELDAAGVAARTVTLARRAEPGPAGKIHGASSEAGALVAAVQSLLEEAQSDLAWRAGVGLMSDVVDVSSYYELKDAIDAGKWARGPWAGGAEDEAAVRAETGAALVCVPLAQPVSVSAGWSTCLYSGYQATEVALFARPGL